ncbi:bifunctional enoyl-CoA hydratase/phosphate acetyltransferase [Bacillus sp. ISL-35]|uniref:bifunctional enoyl-CoA hydratase/phosphate acetyltransferase n=1 Tax=Bacillus sp. ISL-35 TaxID=2819122 RepID=UPI001BE599B2|nr:bifunctional enoyl-CoA hydratase/phosphate acetyltransferase [Bacillus sp. ISL-35]MBT2679653.1 bifunctional enoyl-CoA hydratase/phosphate acetyltransferase [Bacillus sp. ISL-35]MBT2704686.1 bifunctional enoyl-CoA hydratase/phosphate acetyltransferase [Chryseobacterium sp. ISL-80]
MRYRSFKEVIAAAQTRPPVKMSIAAAHDSDVLVAVKEAFELGIIEPYLVGDPQKIFELARELDFSVEDFPVYPAYTEKENAYIAAKQASDGHVQAIMKGFLNSTPFLKGVLDKGLHLKTDRVISHLSVFDIPGSERLICMTDGGINIAPNFQQKKQIILNGVEFLARIGVDQPRVAILAANERVSETMPVTVEADELAILIKKESSQPLLIEGPLPLDLAISRESLLHKKLDSELGGRADLLIVPTIEAGNFLGKAITYFARGTMAGIVLGARVPLVLNSRSDSAEAKLASIALAVVAASNSTVSV